MIRNRLLYGLMLLLGLVFVLAFGGRVPVSLFAALLLLPIFSVLCALFSSRRLELNQTIKRCVLQKGEETAYSITLTNRGRLLCPLVRACFLSECKQVMPEWKKEHYFTLSGRASESLSFALRGTFRGKYPVGVRHLEVLDFLGLFRLKRKANQRLVLKVFPEVMPLTGFHADLGQEASRRELSLLSQEDRTSVSDIKNYRPGDHLKDMHWKLSAKRGELLVKNYEIISNTGATVAVDISTLPYPREKAAPLEDRMIASAVSVEQYLNKKATPCSLAYADDSLHLFGKGHSFDELVDTTAFLPFNGEMGAAELLQSIASRSLISSSVLLFCHAVDRALCEQILRLGAQGLHVTLFFFSYSLDRDAQEKRRLVYELIERGNDCFLIREDGDLKTQMEKK